MAEFQILRAGREWGQFLGLGKLDGKVAIVTGAARGLGRAYAKRLAELGAKVAVADINLRSYEEFEAEAKDMTGESTVAEIKTSGGTALGAELDVTNHEAVEAMVARVVAEWGRVDVLVANAGGGPPLIHEVDDPVGKHDVQSDFRVGCRELRD
jgi:NAD(P)-dependent dehydrogenase (short-subunit alcohol dehydrogenase family)